MKNCETCRYFSDTIAKLHGHLRQVHALCLNKDSPHSQKYQPSTGTCSQYYKGVPIDALKP
jgi:predicted anti-sigma-YlaC factor YlaD